MYDAHIDLDLSLDWLESDVARAWARTDLPLEPIPGFGSSARSSFQQSIAADEAEIMRLENSIRNLRDRISKNRARLAPIRLIPSEILSAIFLDWIYLRDLPESVSREHFVPPCTLMKVCRQWVACAVSTPAIWTHGRQIIDTFDIAFFGLAGLYKSYFDRAGSRNISVHFFSNDEENHVREVWCEIMEPSLFRLETLIISGSDSKSMNWDKALGTSENWSYQKLVMSLTICTRLNRLGLFGIDFPESESETPIALPTVRTIEYYRCKGSPPIHCPNLVACYIEECTVAHSYILSLSRSSPLLEKVNLHAAYMPSGPWFPLPTFPSLKYLLIGFHNNFTIPQCFSDGTIISKLDLYLCGDSYVPAIEVISLGSYSALTSLTLNIALTMVTLDTADVRLTHEWMAEAHKVVDFELIFEPDDPDAPFYKLYGMKMYIEQILGRKRNPPCFPRLKHITIRREYDLESELVQLLSERASDAQRVEAGFPAVGMLPGIVQRPCLLTIVDSDTLPDMESVGLKEFLEICRKQA